MIEYGINNGELHKCNYIGTVLNQIMSAEDLQTAEIFTKHGTNRYYITKAGNKYEVFVVVNDSNICKFWLDNLKDFQII